MSRLTRNQEKYWGKDNYKGQKYVIGSDGITSKQMCLNKLGKIEDLEEELGCPLDVVFKALANGVYYEDVANCMRYMAVDLHLNLDSEYVLYFDDEEYLLTKNYKKTWWLKKDKRG